MVSHKEKLDKLEGQRVVAKSGPITMVGKVRTADNNMGEVVHDTDPQTKAVFDRNAGVYSVEPSKNGELPVLHLR